MERYNDFPEKENHPVFIALGIGGKASDPAELFILPVQELAQPYIHKDRIGKYRKKIDADFFFDQESGQLR